MKCYVCKTGNIRRAGCHEFCDNCSFGRFVVDDNYIETCIRVVASVTSNLTFENDKDFGGYVWDVIRDHLPLLMDYMNTLDEDSGFAYTFVDGVKTNSINLTIGNMVNNEQKSTDLVCQCGNDHNFLKGNVYPKEIICGECRAKYIYSETEHKYMPEFLCECGWAAHTDPSQADGLCFCTRCSEPYMLWDDGTYARLY